MIRHDRPSVTGPCLRRVYSRANRRAGAGAADPTSMPDSLSAGQRVGRYRIDQRLHAGHFAVGYRATADDGTAVFLKQYRLPRVGTPWYREFVEHQASLASKLERDRLEAFTARPSELFEHGGIYYQAFEFLGGGTNLRRALARWRLPDGRARAARWRLARALMEAVTHLHGAGIVHGDLKPENLYVQPEQQGEDGPRLKIIDLDFACLDAQAPPWSSDAALASVGSPFYMSPEHLSGQLLVTASDLFTCGLLLFEMLVGRNPYRGRSPEDYPARVRAAQVPVPAFGEIVPADIDAEALAGMMVACLSLDPAQRPPAYDVLAVLDGQPPLSSTTTGPAG